MRLAAQLLGGFRVDVDGRAVPDTAWHHRRAAELVKLLALAPRHRLPADRVVEVLWRDLTPEAGAANLRKAAHLARRAIGVPDSLVLRGGQVALWPDAEVRTDVEDFEQAAERALRDGDPARCAAALDLYRGDLLPDDRYEDWASEAREPLRLRYLELLRRAGLWEEVVEAEPLDEDAHRRLMRDYAAAGNRAAALREFRRLRDALGRAGMRPDPASVALYDEIARGPAAVAPVSPSPPIVGRATELSSARAAWQSAMAGRGGALLVAGEAGAGKTRLCEELLTEAAAAGATTIRGEARAQDGPTPYAPIAEAIDRLLLQRADFAAGLGDDARAQLGRLTTEVPDPAPTSDAQLERRRIFSAIGQVVSAAAREHGAVLLADDLHAADEASLDLIHYLVRIARFQRLLVVMAYREEEASASLASIRATLVAQREATEIHLGPLPREAVLAVVERVTGHPPDEQAGDEIWTLTGGNPFFAEELARCTRPDGSIDVPAELYSVLQAGLMRLPPELRRALELVAVAGVEFDADEFVALTGLPEADAFELLDAALASHVVEEWEAAYRFRHVLVRDALERSLPGHRRRAAHSEVAQRLRASGAPPARVAHHLMLAGTTREAVRWLERAARHAASVGALSDALGFADDALANAPREERPRLLELRAELLYAMGRPEAPAAYADAVALADPAAVTALRVKQARAHVAAGELDAAARALDGLAPPTGEEQVQVLLARSLVACHRMDVASAEESAAEARELATRHGLGRELGEASALLARAAHLQGSWPQHFRREFAEALSQAPEAAEQVFDTHLCFAEFSLDGPASPDDVSAFARELRSIADEGEIDRGQAIAALMLGEAELLAGRLDSAELCLDEAISLMHAVGARAGESMALVRRGEVELARNRRRDAAAFLEPALTLGRVDPLASHLVVRAYDGLARAAPDLGSRLAVLGEAEVNLGEVEACDPCSIGFLVTAAQAWALEGDLERARDYVEHARRVASMWQGGAWPAAVREARAAVLRAEGETDRADALLREAAELFEQAQQPIDAARCRTLLVAHA